MIAPQKNKDREAKNRYLNFTLFYNEIKKL